MVAVIVQLHQPKKENSNVSVAIQLPCSVRNTIQQQAIPSLPAPILDWAGSNLMWSNHTCNCKHMRSMHYFPRKRTVTYMYIKDQNLIC